MSASLEVVDIIKIGLLGVVTFEVILPKKMPHRELTGFLIMTGAASVMFGGPEIKKILNISDLS